MPHQSCLGLNLKRIKVDIFFQFFSVTTNTLPAQITRTTLTNTKTTKRISDQIFNLHFLLLFFCKVIQFNNQLYCTFHRNNQTNIFSFFNLQRKKKESKREKLIIYIGRKSDWCIYKEERKYQHKPDSSAKLLGEKGTWHICSILENLL